MVENNVNVLRYLKPDYNKFRVELGKRMLNILLHVPILDIEYQTVLNNAQCINSTIDLVDHGNNLSKTNSSNESVVNI